MNDPRIDAAIEEYFEKLDRGEAVEREVFLARHSDIAEALRDFIAAEEELRRLAGDKASRECAGVSTRSFSSQGQETVAPKTQPERPLATTVGGLPGKFGRYQITRELGKGAMGAVYLAEDSQLERKVAIKTPHFEDDPTGELIARFYREARAAATLRHANICPVFDVGQIDGKHFISMAYIEGRPLSDVIRGGKPQNERQIVIAVHKLARALQQAHDHGIVHRDLKPANIMIDKQGEPIIMDFGLARKAHKEGEASLTQSGAILGSPAYMSPEQIEGNSETVGPASDQYNLGVVLYEMLTGQLPFRGSVINVLAQIITKGPTPPSELRPGLDPRIEAVCLKMMAKKGSDRFSSMKAVADQLAAIVKNPTAAPIAPEKSPTASRPTAGITPSSGDAGTSQSRKSIKQKALTESDMTSLEELVRKCARRRDYDQMIQIIERIPENRRNEALQTLLEKAREKIDEIAFLICEIDEADRLNDWPTALKKVEELLRIKPGHHRAREIQEKYSGFGEGAAARIAPLSQFTKPWNEGGWIPWSVLVFGLAVFAVMAGVMVIYLGKTAIMVDIKDPGVEVAVTGTTLTITGPDKQLVKVEPGDQELTITAAGFKASTRSFSLKKGEKKTVTVSIVNKEIVARLENEILAPTPAHDEKATNTIVGGKKPSLPLTLVDGKQTTSTLPTTFKNSLGMEFILVPKGKSWLGGGGSRPSDKEVVMPHDFYMGRYEVTQEEWARVTGLTPSWFSRTGGGKDKVKGIADAELKRFPVEMVSWDDAQVFLQRLNKSEKDTGWFYRLPSAAEWEYACRGGPLSDKLESGYDFYFDKPTNQLLHERANFFEQGKGLERTCKVGSYEPNKLGLNDMHGNVFEWCNDAEKTTWGTPGRARRSGDWCSTELYSRAWADVAAPQDYRQYGTGLRVARVPVGPEPTAQSPPDEKKSITAATTPAGDPDRRAAEWVLSIGGRPGIESDGNERDADQLPPGPFKLRKVYFYNNPKVNDAGLACFKGCRNLKALELWAMKVGDAGLSNFKDCKDLSTLVLDGGNATVTDRGLAYFKNCKDLESLALRFLRGVSDAGIAQFQDCTNLKVLDLYDTKVTDAGLAQLSRCVNLEHLRLGPVYTSREVTDATMRILGNLRRLKALYLGGTQITNAGLAYLEGLAQLETLEIGGTRVRGLGLAHLRNLVRLKNLNLGALGVTDGDLVHLRSLTALESLDLNGTRVSGPGLANLRDMNQLRDLDLNSSRIANSGLEQVKSLPQLQKLHLRGTHVTDAGLHHLKGMTNLDELDLTDTKVTAAGLKKLAATLPSCKIEWDGRVIESKPDTVTTNAPSVVASHTPADADRRAANAVLALGGSVSVRVKGVEREIPPGGSLPPEPIELTRVQLNDRPELSDAQIEPLQAASHLLVVWLRFDRNIGDAGLAYLRNHTSLRELNLSGTRVTDAGMATVEGLVNLQLLAVERTNVTEAGLAHIEKLTELQTLWIGNGVRLTDDGLAHLQNLSKLRHITLWGAPLKGPGLKYLAGLQHLETLALGRTRITDAGLVHLESLNQLRILRLGRTRVTPAGVAKLQKALPGCRIIAR